MAATYAYDERPTSGHPLLPGASPAAIRDGLLPADRARFDAAYAVALAESRQSLDLTELFKTLEHWRRVAVLQSDPANYRRMVRRVAETLTGQPVPDDEPLELTRTKAGMQVYRVVTDEQVQQQIEVLPADALSAIAELRVLLEVDPWSGASVSDRNPDGPVRILAFGANHEGIAAYLIFEDQRRVDLLQITWLG